MSSETILLNRAVFADWESMNPETLRTLNYASEFLYPAITMTDGIRDEITKFMRQSLGSSDISINYHTEDTIDIVKTHGGVEQTQIILTNEHIRIRHGREDIHGFDWYKKVIEDVVRFAFETMGFPFIYQQNHSISKIVAMEGDKDSRPFLAEHVAQFGVENLSVLSPSLPAVGFRFLWFSQETASRLAEYDLKIEPHFQNIRQIFLFAKTRFMCLPPIQSMNLAEIPAAFDKTDDAITNKAIKFLEKFLTTEEGK